MPNESHALIKVIILGDSGVGKTALLNRFTLGKFSDRYQATIGADFVAKEVLVNDKRAVLQIWDTAGQERFQSLGTAFYRGADACVLVYDVTRPKTLKGLELWKDEFLIHAAPRDPEDFPFVIIGNKIDLVDEEAFESERTKLWFDEIPSVKHFVASAKSAFNVKMAFQVVAGLAMIREAFLPDSSQEPNDTELDTSFATYKSNSCSC